MKKEDDEKQISKLPLNLPEQIHKEIVEHHTLQMQGMIGGLAPRMSDDNIAKILELQKEVENNSFEAFKISTVSDDKKYEKDHIVRLLLIILISIGFIGITMTLIIMESPHLTAWFSFIIGACGGIGGGYVLKDSKKSENKSLKEED